MQLEINRTLFARSDRVKAVDFHPTEPWLLTGLYNGTVNIYNTSSGALVKTFEVAEVPVRCVRFIARKNWFVAGSDDFQLRVFNYNTHDKVTAFEAHPDYIRCLTVHPSASVVLTGSDDMMIKAWDWDKGWKCIMTFEGHAHYIMNLSINPKDPTTFASSCLDRTVKIWSLTNPVPNFTLEAHDKGVNYVSFYPGPDKPYLLTTGDDRSLKIWDYLSKSCVQTLEGHSNNVSFAVFHPSLPLIISGSEDGTVKVWNSGTYRLETTLSYALERAWCVSLMEGSSDVAIGYDEGVVVVKLGRDEPTYSMDSSGKLVYTKNTEVVTANLAALEPTEDTIPVHPPLRDLGSVDTYPTQLLHSPNNRFLTSLGSGEYTIYTSLNLRNKSYGSGTSFAWSSDSNTYAVLEGRSKIRAYKNFKEKTGTMKGSGGFALEGLCGGPVLGGRGSGFVLFWDWESGEVVRRVDVDATNVFWSVSGTLVTITTATSFFVLKFDRSAYDAAVESGVEITDEGVEEAFEVVCEIPEGIKTAKWIEEDTFVYTTNNNRLNYLLGTETYTIANLDSQMYLLGFIPSHSRIYVASKTMSIISYTLSTSLLSYQASIIAHDTNAASSLLPSIPSSQHTKLARFLETQASKEDSVGRKEEYLRLAQELTTDSEHKFELALTLHDTPTALTIAGSLPPGEAAPKYRLIGNRALEAFNFDLARDCFTRAEDYHSLFLLALAGGDKPGLEKVAHGAVGKGAFNLAFAAQLQLGDPKGCVDMLLKTGRTSEAALFARTYAPSQVSPVVKAWKASLQEQKKEKIAESIADPESNEELFANGWKESLKKETSAVAST